MSGAKPTADRFWTKVAVAGPNDCWLWQGATASGGYGRVRSSAENRVVQAHRLSWELTHGPIASGLQIDHLCRNPTCVNPAHLEPVTPRENQIRSSSFSGLNAAKKHCKRGHLLAGDNLYVRPDGSRLCRACHALRARSFRRRRAGA